MQESATVRTEFSSAYEYHTSVYALARWKRRLLRLGVVYMAHKPHRGTGRIIAISLAAATAAAVAAAAATSTHPLIVIGLVIVGVVSGIFFTLKLLDII